MRSGTEFAREIKLTDWSMAGNLSNRSSGVQIPRDICTRLRRYLYSAKCSWIIIKLILWCKLAQKLFDLVKSSNCYAPSKPSFEWFATAHGESGER